MVIFEERYNKLNTEQKKAVDTIEGPVLVIAGPGSGKTEILSLRVANILQKTDTSAASILCLTFTDSAAVNMRERLFSLIGKDAYRTQIHTFHDFGVEVIGRHPEFFYGGASFSPADELTQMEILEEIFNKFSFDNPLRSQHPEQGYVYLSPVKRAIGQLKKAGLTPDEFDAILDHNLKSLEYINPQIEKIFSERLSKKQFSVIESLVDGLQTQASEKFPVRHMKPLIPAVADSLKKALEEAIEEDITEPLSEWKQKWTKKDDNNKRVFKDALYTDKLKALVDVYKEYSKRMYVRGYYDFDDMLLDVIQAVEKNDVLRYELQEQYQYILVDEFQDTNDAQMRLLNSLIDVDVHEGRPQVSSLISATRPNIMAVGDDDQAIFKFQGAEISNILNFKDTHREPVIITLTHSYRSTQNILDLARHIIQKGENRLENLIANMQKVLIAAKEMTGQGNIDNKIFKTKAQEYFGVADEIKRLIESGKNPKDIAVIARQHKSLEEIVPYFNRAGVPVSYERQQNVLDEPHIRQLIQMARFSNSLFKKNTNEADNLLPEILSYPFWGLERKLIWQLSVDANKQNILWLDAMMKHGDKRILNIAEFLIDVTAQSASEPMEHIIDVLIGSHVSLVSDSEDEDDDKEAINKTLSEFSSPFRQYYFARKKLENNRAEYLRFLSGLRVFVQSLREYRHGQLLKLDDLINFVDLHEKNNIAISDRSLFVGATQAVNLLTAHKAKGLEFDTVFVIDCQDDVWAGRGRGLLLPFPQNLPIAPASDNLDDQLRIFYVAITRAKNNLHLTSYEIDENGKESSRLQFLLSPISDLDPRSAYYKQTSAVIDGGTCRRSVDGVREDDKVTDLLKIEEAEKFEDANIALLETYYSPPFIQDEKSLLESLVKDYQMSVTHFNNFLDTTKGGPQLFLEQNLLRFPQAKTISGSYGSAMHKAIELMYVNLKKDGKLPSLENVLFGFKKELQSQRMSERDFNLCKDRGVSALKAFYNTKKDTFNSADRIEVNFKNQGVIVGGAILTGKIDKMVEVGIGEISVHDFKTGSPKKDWKGITMHEKIQLYNYQKQLIFYKLLVENSREFGGKYKVNTGILEFLEPLNGRIIDHPILRIEDDMATRLSKLAQIVYKKIINLDFPDVGKYSKDLKGILEFEEDLLNEKI